MEQNVYAGPLMTHPVTKMDKTVTKLQLKYRTYIVEYDTEDSLKHVGVYLPTPVFSHGQLYVVVSRVTSREGLKMLITDEDGEDTNVTSNIVYEEVFRNV
ncbi:PIF1 helicase, putative [Medicago truncatula]|uniref:PIF1 helicase, putative n=1 Tax=Medicago truncatula TaxID=3880 RepID=A0A072UWE5_MEDTR|nr:PIF1 helicase, putative [Medicago truncatula]KEH33756.1 PIF1 helicase, putative [Medicago truncatula]